MLVDIRDVHRPHAPPPLVRSRTTIGLVEPHHSHRGSATPRTPTANSARANSGETFLPRLLPPVR